MRQTYELYLTDPEGRTEFRPLTCYPQQVLIRTREVLVEFGARAVEVRQFGASLWTLVAAEPSRPSGA